MEADRPSWPADVGRGSGRAEAYRYTGAGAMTVSTSARAEPAAERWLTAARRTGRPRRSATPGWTSCGPRPPDAGPVAQLRYRRHPAARVERDAFLALHAREPASGWRGRAPAVLRPAGHGGRQRALHRPAGTVRRRTASPCCWTGGRRPPSRSTGRPRPTPTARQPAAPDHPRPRGSTGIDDEVLDLDALPRPSAAPRRWSADGALMLALTPPRTGRMRDIVATIQAEQDGIIRAAAGRRAGGAGWPGHRQDGRRAAPGRLPALHPPRPAGPHRGAGGRARQPVPGLHRAGPAQPRRDRRGAGDRRPAATRASTPRRHEPAARRRSRATCGWPGCWPRAVRARQRVPRVPVALDVEGSRIALLYRRDVEQARQPGRSSPRKPHNEARVRFVGRPAAAAGGCGWPRRRSADSRRGPPGGTDRRLRDSRRRPARGQPVLDAARRRELLARPVRRPRRCWPRRRRG